MITALFTSEVCKCGYYLWSTHFFFFLILLELSGRVLERERQNTVLLIDIIYVEHIAQISTYSNTTFKVYCILIEM